MARGARDLGTVVEVDTFTRDGLTFDVLDAGPVDGDVVILLHGFPQDAHAWDAVTPVLGGTGLRTLAPWQRGYCPGATPREIERYEIGELVADVRALADAAGADRVHVVGHDWGAVVAWEMALRHPDRVATLTALSVPAPGAMAWATRKGPQLVRSWYIGAFCLPVLPERALANARGRLDRSGLDPAAARGYAERFPDPSSFTGPLAWYRAMGWSAARRSRVAHLRPLAGPPTAGAVRIPTTFAWGLHDQFISRAAAERCGRFVTAPYRFVELDANHWLPENEPDAVADLVLQRVRATG